MKPAVRPILAAARGRLYSAQAARAAEQVDHSLNLPKQEAEISRLSNGAVVVSLENYSPISRVGIVYGAGSRYETRKTAGITHCLRNASNLSTEKSTNFGITRAIQQLGGNIMCTSTREHILYSLTCIRDDLNVGVEFLGHMATAPVFKTWELQDARPQLELDLAVVASRPEVQVLESLHKAAYRDTLGHSLYMPPHKVGQHSPEMMQAFVTDHLIGSNLGMVGLGVEHSQLVRLAQKHIGHVPSGSHKMEKAVFHGGERRQATNTPLAYAAVVTEGAGLNSTDATALAILQAAMGSGPSVKYGTCTATSKVSQAAAQATSHPYAATCINLNYSDIGMFGFQVVSHAKDIVPVLKSVATKFASVTKDGISNEDLQRAKNQVKANALMQMENSNDTLELLASEAMIQGKVYTSADIVSAIDAVTLTDVNNAAKKVINGKPAMAATGDLSYAPYLDEIVK